jgi:hypothetical protein
VLSHCYPTSVLAHAERWMSGSLCANDIYPESFSLETTCHTSNLNICQMKPFWPDGCLCSFVLSFFFQKFCYCRQILFFDNEFSLCRWCQGSVSWGNSFDPSWSCFRLWWAGVLNSLFLSCFTMHQDGWGLERRFQMVWPWAPLFWWASTCVF